MTFMMANYSFDVLLSRSFFQLVGDLTELNEKIYSDLAESESRDLLAAPESEASEASGDSDACAAEDIELGDLEMVATLGVGGFGRVELVKVSDIVRVRILISPVASAGTSGRARCLHSSVCPSSAWWRRCSR